MIKKLLLSLLLFAAFPSWSAVTILGTATSEQGHSLTPSVAHTVASGTGRVSYITIFANGGSGVTSVGTFGGVTPVLVGSYADNSMFIYRAVNPAVGATTASAVIVDDVYWSIHVTSLQGVDTTTPDDALQNATEVETINVSSPSVTSAVGDLVLGFGLMVYPDISAFAGATLSTSEPSIDGGVVSTAVVYEAGAATVVVGVQSTTVSFGDNRMMAFNVNASGGGGGSTVPVKIYQYLNRKKR